MTKRIEVSVGDRYERLVIVSPEGPRRYANKSNPLGYRTVQVQCDCGSAPYHVLLNSLRNGNTRSCGCLRRETTSGRNLESKRTHGLRKHPLYATWVGIRQRCNNPNNPNWEGYGSRGIRVCERWEDLATFVADVEGEIGPRPEERSPGGKPVWSLDRKDNDGHYEPGNIRWATAREQMLNTRKVNVLSRQVAVLEAENARLRELLSGKPIEGGET
jgi:hypothetical protein